MTTVSPRGKGDVWAFGPIYEKWPTQKYNSPKLAGCTHGIQHFLQTCAFSPANRKNKKVG